MECNEVLLFLRHKNLNGLIFFLFFCVSSLPSDYLFVSYSGIPMRRIHTQVHRCKGGNVEFKNVKLEFIFHYFGKKGTWSATITSVKKG